MTYLLFKKKMVDDQLNMSTNMAEVSDVKKYGG